MSIRSNDAKASEIFFVDTLRHFKTHLTKYPTAKFGAYCRLLGLNYEYVMHWASRNGVSIRHIKEDDLKCFKRLPMRIKKPKNTPQPLPVLTHSDARGFINFIPGGPIQPLCGGMLHGISVNFPDGVNLTLQSCTAADLASLLTIYASRKEAVPCLG